MSQDEGFWDRLGMDEGGLPVHLPMGVTAKGEGPTDDRDAHHLECWCADRDCKLGGALMWAYRLGRKEGTTGEFRAGATEVVIERTIASPSAQPVQHAPGYEYRLLVQMQSELDVGESRQSAEYLRGWTQALAELRRRMES